MKKIEKIYFWPPWFADALSNTKRQKIAPRLIKNLQKANLFLWRALNIYDDFLDQSGINSKLPVANGYYRRYLEIYYRLNLPEDFYRLFNRTMAHLDRANERETKENHFSISNGRVPSAIICPAFDNLTVLADKSLALGLGPIAILYHLDPEKAKTAVPDILSFFRYALAAKQLADDARDWFSDLKNGIITPANLTVLQAAQEKKLPLDLNKEPITAYLLFSQKAAEKIVASLSRLCQQTRNAAKKAELRPGCQLIEEIIGPIEKGVTEVAQFRTYWLKKA